MTAPFHLATPADVVREIFGDDVPHWIDLNDVSASGDDDELGEGL